MNGLTKNFKAPWSKGLVVVSALLTALVLYVGIRAWITTEGGQWAMAICVVVLGLPVLFVVRGYALTPTEILVRRLFWSTRFSRRDLRAARHDPRATRFSIRTFGIGGLYSISGWFYNKRLGSYRAYVTDPKRAVILQFRSRNVVISPENPEAFVNEILGSYETIR